MSTYAKLDEQGFVVYTLQSEIEQPGCVLLDFDIGKPASPYERYNFQSRQWEDTRTDQQKLDNTKAPILEKRSKLLISSDWTQMPDVTLANKPAWATYRQALRDITAQTGYPFNIVWPTPPQ